MSTRPSAKSGRVLAALRRLGWVVKRERGSHKTLAREGWADVLFAFHDGEEIGPRMLARIAKQTGLQPEDLRVSARTAAERVVHADTVPPVTVSRRSCGAGTLRHNLGVSQT
jgi:predicted RNA binding protein YcfA (HicA-like mRNA interferase family)